jgi:hypothetical protein
VIYSPVQQEKVAGKTTFFLYRKTHSARGDLTSLFQQTGLSLGKTSAAAGWLEIFAGYPL